MWVLYTRLLYLVMMPIQRKCGCCGHWMRRLYINQTIQSWGGKTVNRKVAIGWICLDCVRDGDGVKLDRVQEQQT